MVSCDTNLIGTLGIFSSTPILAENFWDVNQKFEIYWYEYFNDFLV